MHQPKHANVGVYLLPFLLQTCVPDREQVLPYLLKNSLVADHSRAIVAKQGVLTGEFNILTYFQETHSGERV